MKNRVIEVQNIPVSISKKESDDYFKRKYENFRKNKRGIKG